MFKTLRGRLLLSYLAIISLVLLMMTMALFFVAARPAVRYFPVMQQLSTISQSHRRELLRLHEAGVDLATMKAALTQLAADSGSRILLVRPRDQRVLFDSSDRWMNETVSEIIPISTRLLTDVDQNAAFGRFQASDDTRWLIYAPSTNIANDRVQIYYIQREPTTLSFFRNTFFQPLAVAGALALLLAVLLALGIAAWVARPLQKMAVAAEAIAQGDYDQQLPPQGPEEVQRVAASFNSMAAQVRLSRQAQQDFVANVSHDLKTPITSIQGWSQSLLDGTADSARKRQQAADVINKEADRYVAHGQPAVGFGPH